MNTANLIFSALGLAGLGIVGIAVKALYLNVEKVPTNAAVRVMSSIFAVFVLLIGATLAGLTLSYVLTKEWSALPHFMLLACLCGISIYFQLKPARKSVAAAKQAAFAPERVEPTVSPVTQAVPAVAPASAEQPASAASAVAAPVVAATAVAPEVDEASLPHAPPPAVISAVSDDVLDSWTPEEDEVEVSAPSAQSTSVEPAVASEVVDATPVTELSPESALEMPAHADIEEFAAVVQPEAPVAAAPSMGDEAADVLDLSGVTKVSDTPDTVIAEHRVDVVEPASDNEAARPVVAAPSEISAAVA
jgi:hypothetical protein